MEINLIKAEELMETLIANSNKFVEAKLLFNNISATHFLLFENNKLYDEGIDGEERITTPADFIKHYQNSYWKIDNIV